MVDYDKKLAAELEKVGLPVYYELWADSTVEQPCISYLPAGNNDHLIGDNLFYYNVSYYVKLWGHDKEELAPYLETMRTIMRELGFKVVTYNELASDTELCIVCLFRGIGYEKL